MSAHASGGGGGGGGEQIENKFANLDTSVLPMS